MEITLTKAVAISAQSEGELAGKLTSFFRSAGIHKDDIASIHFYDENLERIMSNCCIVVFQVVEDR